MPYISDASLDLALNDVRNNAEELHICSQEPSTYTEATATYSLGQKNTPTIGAPIDRVASGGGRECVVSSFTDGVVDGNGTATHWALVKATPTSRLLATGAMSGAGQVVTAGNAFTMAQFAVGITDALSA